jgi:iron donor protein CyaY
MAMEEVEYRRRIQETFDRIDRALENEDPDEIECEQAQGALTIRVKDGSKCILSAQPSVRQLWMALAGKGVAYHFNFDASSNHWMDDKGKGLEVFEVIRSYLKERVTPSGSAK